MNNFDDLFTPQSNQSFQGTQPFDKEAWAEKKQAERQAIYDLADTTAEAVSADGSNFRRIWMCRPALTVTLLPIRC